MVSVITDLIIAIDLFYENSAVSVSNEDVFLQLTLAFKQYSQF